MNKAYNAHLRTAQVICLCSNHLKKKKHNKRIIIQRVQPLCKKQSKCERCSKSGYDYFVYFKQNKRSNQDE
jgi:hypothetical protein